MSRRFRLREIPSDQEGEADDTYKIDRRDFMRHSFNAAAGLITVSLGSVGFASLLMGTSENDGGTPPLGSGSPQEQKTQCGTELNIWNRCPTPLLSMPQPNHPQAWLGPKEFGQASP